MRTTDWHFISRRIEKRKRITDKESEVYIDGCKVPPEKVRKETNRHGFLTTIERLEYEREAATSPQTPAGVVVCSPAPTVSRYQWAEEMPWLKFLKTISSQRIWSKICTFIYFIQLIPAN